MLSYLMRVLVQSLLLTLAVELLAALVWGYRKRDLGIVALANLLTNPIYVSLVFYLRYHMHPDRLLALRAGMECVIICVEGLLYQRHLRQKKHPYLFSLAANLASIAAGILLSRIP